MKTTEFKKGQSVVVTTKKGKVLGKLCSMCDFTTIERGEKYITIQHDETGLVVAYTSEERLNVKN